MFQDLFNILVNKKSVFITNDFMRYAKPCDNVLTDEISHSRTSCLGRAMASTHFEKYSVATKIQMYPPEDGLIGPMRSSPQVWMGHGVGMFCKLVRCVDQISLKLASVTKLNEVYHVLLHSWPVIAKSQ